jgi:DNA-binding CsgD family transcriptional regulator
MAANDKPTAKQLRYLRALCDATGETTSWPKTRQEASRAIERLKTRPRQTPRSATAITTRSRTCSHAEAVREPPPRRRGRAVGALCPAAAAGRNPSARPTPTREDGCAFAWAQLCRTQSERGEYLFAWLRTTAICQTGASPSASGENPLGAQAEPAWEDHIEAPKPLEQVLAGRDAAELTSLREREGRYLALLAAGYTYREIAAREGVIYTKVNKYLARASGRARALREGARHTAPALRQA